MKRLCIFLFVMVLTVGCASLSGNEPRTVSKLVTGDLSLVEPPARRFAIYPVVNGSYLAEGPDRDLIIGTTRDEIREIMVGKGYVPVSLAEEPDFIIGFGLGVESRITDEEIFKKTGLVAGLSTEGINQAAFQKGSILVALFKPGAKEPAWRVLAQGMAEMKKSEASRKQAIHELLAVMLSPVPPAGKGIP
ncbi:DUF4136 domain-containing protein [Desulfoluna spongiiphila]|uniref:DUF4136 domain-containing protein n=1 Tax=Desulfoluna spongiiphila TaxID=419481 RepID=A0A1G5BQK1_9BACT|nr:DUF4136 domain-containing protein [Desulfoluna spongiiphila]SCX92462.1 protein of unknown function [Desulfoluna spongiiphila]VVS93862.1 prokaryotic membrane lipoprotein lipid attachment site profile [Desulfoluna spongiiphila]